MDPLSALRVAVPAATGAPGALPGGLAVPRNIPSPELQQLGIAPPLSDARQVGGVDPFENVLGRMVGEVNARQNVASDKVRGLLSGQDVSLHETMISMEEASVSFQLMVEVRNKLLESYQELMRMQV